MILAFLMSIKVLWLRRLLLVLYDHWKIVLCVIAVVLLIVIIRFSSCGTPSVEKEREKVIETQINANRALEQKANVEVNVNESVKNTNTAEKEREKAVNANLSEKNGNYSEADKRFCQEFPEACK